MSTPLLAVIPPTGGTNTDQWMDHAICSGHPNPEFWFPPRGQVAHEAIAICSQCPVQADCLEHAVTRNEPIGIWGGVSERRRRVIRKERRLAREVQAPSSSSGAGAGGGTCAAPAGPAPALHEAGRAAQHP